MDAYTHLQQHNSNHKELVRKAKNARTAKAAQARKTGNNKNVLVQLLTVVTRG